MGKQNLRKPDDVADLTFNGEFEFRLLT